MGLRLTATNDDFSGISIGLLGPSTSVTNQLLMIAALGIDEPTTELNYTGTLPLPQVVGTPSFNLSYIQSNDTNKVDLNIVAGGGSRTMCFVFYVPPAGTNGFPFGAFAAAPTYGEYIAINTSEIRFETISVTPSTNYPVIPRTSGRYEMIFVIIDSGVGATLYRPRDNATSYKPYASNYNLTTEYQTSLYGQTSTTNASLFCFWQRNLTTSECNTVYSDFYNYLANRGVVIS